MDRYQKAAQNRAKATDLNKTWNVGATQCRYRETGNWYHILERFPAALFDAHGYIVFSSAEELAQTEGVLIGKQISVPGGISQLAGYRRMVDPSVQVIFEPDTLDEETQYWEGAVRRVSVNAYERDPRARRCCIDHFGAVCQICGFDFGSTYGSFGDGFIHVHHPFWRNQGLQARAWPEFEKRFGKFGIERPISRAMAGFLASLQKKRTAEQDEPQQPPLAALSSTSPVL